MGEPRNLSNEILQITDGIHNVSIDIRARSNYSKAFNKIVDFVQNHARQEILDDELTVTKTLAEPFTIGGLLVLLLEPRGYRPWSGGIETVISDCPTLDSLNEGIQIGSGGALSLHTVSTIDLHPFLAKHNYATLECDKQEELNKLHMQIVGAKHEQDATNALKKWQNVSRLEFWERASIVFATHPSYSVNHNSEDRRCRKALLKSICEACERVGGAWDENAWEQQYSSSGLHVPLAIHAMSSRSQGHQDVKNFLDLIMMLCFKPVHRLPELLTSRLALLAGLFGLVLSKPARPGHGSQKTQAGRPGRRLWPGSLVSAWFFLYMGHKSGLDRVIWLQNVAKAYR
ncbi:hypothetical protein DM02DRAFT_698162 [Periconia macrospinosa]|uniref:Uncharacterized protein n=1 Tax=Periconia macrospinosa TaxID=97972 RepID=A0A2V1DZ18_9PLEO|nr:hypothetical protein DM02DRAFT_698162 [Periconia macrospinosa]